MAGSYNGIQSDISGALDSAVTAEAEILRLTNLQADAKNRLNKMEKTTANQILSGALLQLKVQAGVAKKTGQSAFSISLMEKSMTELTALNAALTREKNPISFEEFLIQFELLQRYPNEVRATFQSIEQTVATFNGVMAKRNQKIKTLFSEEEDAAQSVVDRLVSLNLAAKETERTVDGMTMTKGAVEAAGLIIELNTEIENMSIPSTFGTGQEAVAAFISRIQEARTNINTMTTTLATSKGQIAQLGKATKSVIGGQVFLQEETNKVLNAELDLIKEKMKFGNEMHEVEGERYEDTEAYNKLLTDQNAINAKIVDTEVIKTMKAVAQLKITKQMNDLTKKRHKNDQKAFTIAAKANAPGGRLTPKMEFELALKLSKQKVKDAQLDFKFLEVKLTAEREYLKATMIANGVEESHRIKVLELLDAQSKIVKEIGRETMRTAGLGVTETIQGGAGEYDTGFDRMGSEGFGVAAIKTQMESMKSVAKAHASATEATREYSAAVKEKDELATAAAAAEGTPGEADANRALAEAQAAANTAGIVMTQANKAVGQAATKMISDTLTAMTEALRELGPEGVLAATLGELSNTMLTSVVGAMEVMAISGENTAMKLSAGFAAAANIIGGIAAVLKAQSNVAVDAIDKQIDAEKKLDGQSAKSVAKINAMEAKKESIKKKAFDVNKKLMIAQAVMATAAGIAGALAQTAVLGPFALVLAGMIGAMGLAQIAVISGTSYQSAGSSVSASGPSGIGIGERGKGVDLASSQSARGELSYLRGEEGTGGSGNFKPAFTGAKYRASGGETAGFMVGEQGPEMFIPDRSGRIAPADEVQAGGAPAQVTFNINTIDASGVEDMLTVQRGNIIGMIRTAANSYGQSFIEEIDTSTLQNNASAMGVGRY